MSFPGNCFYEHSQKRLWIDIPKNASKSISQHLRFKLKWKHGNYVKDNIFDYESIIVVRDPIQRWKGSTIEVCFHHLFHNKYSFENFETWLERKNWKNFDRIGDLHHKPISWFCDNRLSNKKYIAMDKNFNQTVESIFGIKDLVTLNTTADNKYKKQVEPYIDEILSDESFLNKLKEYYKEDIELFETIRTK